MIKVLTREYLATYVYLESEIKRLRRRIKYYKDHPLQAEHGVVRGSMPQFPYAECHFVVSGANVKSSEERDKQIKQLLINLKGNELLFEDMKLDIETFLETLPLEKIEVKQILALKYVDRMSDERIAGMLYMSRRTLNRKIDAFLDEMDECDDL